MAQALVKGFLSLDAGQGGGVVDISALASVEGDLYTNAKTRIDFNPIGVERMTRIAGKIEADVSTIIHYLPPDTADTLYNDLIDSWDDQTVVTFVFRPTSGVKATTNPEITVLGRIMDDPTHFADNELIESRFALEITQVTFDNVTTVITT